MQISFNKFLKRKPRTGTYMSKETKKAESTSGTSQTTTALKYDSGKPRVSLLQGRALYEVMKVAEMGARKYGDHNYRKGMGVTRYLDAAFRHAFVQWMFMGEDLDAESGLSHLAHAAWNLLSALELMLTKPEFDNRYKEVPIERTECVHVSNKGNEHHDYCGDCNGRYK